MAWVTSRPFRVGTPDETSPDGPLTTTCVPRATGSSAKVSVTAPGSRVTVVPSAGLVRSSTSWANAAVGAATRSPRAISAEARRRIRPRLRRAPDAVHRPPEAPVAVPVQQPPPGARPLEGGERAERVGGRERVRRSGAGQPERLQPLPLGAHLVG